MEQNNTITFNICPKELLHKEDEGQCCSAAIILVRSSNKLSMVTTMIDLQKPD